jgi:HAD superfamily hydrolase (TIGR01490 family)
MTEPAENQAAKSVAFFDFDGTLTTGDTLMPFIKFVVGAPRYYAKLVLLSPVLLAYFARLIRNDLAKQIVLKQYLAGYPIDELYELGKRFSEEVIPTLLRPEGMERLRWHQAQGHQCVLVSASLEVYLTHWAKKEGFERVLATVLAQCPDHRVTGGLEGNNCHGVAKADRIKKTFQNLDTRRCYAYGDTPGDHPMLDLADEGFVIKRGRFVRYAKRMR